MSWCVSPWVYPVWDPLCLLDLIDYFRYHVGEIFNYNLFKIFLITFIFSFFFWDPYNSNVGAFNMVPEVSETVLRSFYFFFPLFFSSKVISKIWSSSSRIRYSASDILLLIPSRVFLISVIMLFVSICLFLILLGLY